MSKQEIKISNEYLKKKQEIELKKLELENSEIEFKQSKRFRRLEYLKAYAGISGFITGIVAIVTIGFSVFQWSTETEQNRNVRVEERLDKTILNLGSNSTQTRLASVIALHTFLDKNHEKYHQQVLLSLVNMLSNEKESGVRSAIVQLLAETDSGIIKKEILEKTQTILINFSKFHLETGELYEKRITNEFRIPPPDSQEGIARDIAKGILELLNKGIKINDMSSIFCIKCDFSGLDLQGVSFEDAILTWANFSNCNLKGANFDGADLEETKFISADLASTYFTYYDNKHPGYRNHYVERQLDQEQYQTAVFGPDFTNANLTGADFTGHILFGFSNDSSENGVMIFNPSFRSANLTNTKFESIGIYGTTFNYSNNSKKEHNEILPFFPLLGEIGLPLGRVMMGINKIGFNVFLSKVDSATDLSTDIGYFQQSTREIYSQFEGSNWKDAIWPDALKELLIIEKKNVHHITKNERH
jgi:uncharacterized protein YjbI with pentapeptide repeats